MESKLITVKFVASVDVICLPLPPHISFSLYSIKQLCEEECRPPPPSPPKIGNLIYSISLKLALAITSKSGVIGRRVPMVTHLTLCVAFGNESKMRDNEMHCSEANKQTRFGSKCRRHHKRTYMKVDRTYTHEWYIRYISLEWLEVLLVPVSIW